MNTGTAGPELSSEPPAAACPHCGAGGGGVVDPTAEDIAMLGRLAAIGMRMVERAEQQVEAAGRLGHEEMVVLEMASRTVRRTLALRERLFRDSLKTPEQLAAERAARAERARLREAAAPAPGARPVTAETGCSDRENLLSDLHERLLEPEIAQALTREEAGAMILKLCKTVGIVPQDEWWSQALVAQAVAATHAEMGGAVAPGDRLEDWREGVEFSAPPGVVTKRGRFTFGADGAVVAEEPRDVPQAEWPPGIVSGRDPPDTG